MNDSRVQVDLFGEPALTDPGQVEQEYQAPYARWLHAPGPDSNSAMVAALAPVIDGAVTRYGGRVPSPSLRGRAKQIALKALSSYDPSRAGMRPYLNAQLQGLQRHAIKQQQLLRVPGRLAATAARMSTVEEELEDTLGRPATDVEIADHTGLSVRRIREARRYRPGFTESQIAAQGGDDDDALDPAVAGVSRAPQAIAFLYPDLDPVDQLIVDFMHGRNGRPKLKPIEIARRLNVSPSAVSQRAARVAASLQTIMDSGIF